MEKLENGKYLFFEKYGKAYIVKTDNVKKSKNLCNKILNGYLKYNKLENNNYPEKVINDTLYVISRDSSFADIELKNDYVSLKAKYFGGAYKFSDFVVC